MRNFLKHKLREIFGKHNHAWNVVFKGGHMYLEQCIDCLKYRSSIWDYSAKKFRQYEGNIVYEVTGSSQVLILCRTHKQFQNMMRSIPPDHREFYTFLGSPEKLRGMLNMHPIIFFGPEWWEVDFLNDEYLQEVLNNRR